jgi:glucose/arabinose dehydrogenase
VEEAPATEGYLPQPIDVEAGPDGSIYVADKRLLRVRRIRTDGKMVTVAGNGQWGFGQEGAEATQASLQNPRALAVAADGTLYIADASTTDQGRIRRVHQGLIRTVAGGGSPKTCCGDLKCYCGDGGPAAAASMMRPQGVAVAPDDSLYAGDYQAAHVYHIKPAFPRL